MNDQPCCACLTVKYTPKEQPDHTMRERWQCESCGAKFVRLSAAIKTAVSASDQVVVDTAIIKALHAENKVLAESLLEAMEWNWMSDDWPEVMGNTFKKYADKALASVSTRQCPHTDEVLEKGGMTCPDCGDFIEPYATASTLQEPK